MREETKASVDVLSSMWERMEEARALVGVGYNPNVPDTAFTSAQYADRYKLQEDTARRQLKLMVKKGVLQSGRTYRPSSNGHCVLTKVYWMTEEGTPCKVGSSGVTKQKTGKT